MSTRDLQMLTGSFVHGFRDCVLGFLSFYKLDQLASANEERQKSTTTMTELQRRREEKAPRKEVRKEKPPRIRSRIVQCCLLNGGMFLISIFIFNRAILPGLEVVTRLMLGHEEGTRATVWAWLSTITSWLFGFLWILPLFILSRIISFIWFQDIADAAYSGTYRKSATMNVSLGMMIADLLFSLLIQTLFLCQAQLAAILPLAGVAQMLSVFHISLLYAFYAFEYKWFNLGWEISRRLRYIETRWSYFVGFGLPLALATSWSDSYWINGCIFSVLFPLLIVSANEAAPVAQEAPFELPVFACVVRISNDIIGKGVVRAQMNTSSKPSPSRARESSGAS